MTDAAPPNTAALVRACVDSLLTIINICGKSKVQAKLNVMEGIELVAPFTQLVKGFPDVFFGKGFVCLVKGCGKG